MFRVKDFYFLRHTDTQTVKQLELLRDTGHKVDLVLIENRLNFSEIRRRPLMRLLIMLVLLGAENETCCPTAPPSKVVPMPSML
jgi:hypothetical protein